VLLSDPQLLLLDEPTNHLDVSMLEWLEGWLHGYRGAALIVSHDRAFLDHSVTRILDLDPLTHSVRSYSGSYSDYIEQKGRERERQYGQWRDEQAEIRRMKQDIAATRNRRCGSSVRQTSRQPGVRRYAKKVARKALSVRRSSTLCGIGRARGKAGRKLAAKARIRRRAAERAGRAHTR